MFERLPTPGQNTKKDPEDLATQISRGIRGALTSDFAETFELNDAPAYFANGRYLRRIMFLGWDGKIPSIEPQEVTEETTSGEKTYPYEVILSVLGFSVNLAKLESLPSGETPDCNWPDRLEVQLVNRQAEEFVHVGLFIASKDSSLIEPTLGTSYVKSATADTTYQDVEYYALELARTSSIKGKPGSEYDDLLIVKNVLQFGEFDQRATKRTLKYYQEQQPDSRINHYQSISLASDFVSKLLDKFLPRYTSVVGLAERSRRSKNTLNF